MCALKRLRDMVHFFWRVWPATSQSLCCLITALEIPKRKRSPHHMTGQAQRRGRGIAPTHSQPSTSRWVVSTMLWPLYTQERPSTHCTGGWVGLGGQSRWHRKSRLHRYSALDCPDCRLQQVTIPSMPSRLPFRDSISKETIGVNKFNCCLILLQAWSHYEGNVI
jgi:hypothetical protein